MKKALVITGGYLNFDRIDFSSHNFDIIVAADSGYVAAEKLGLLPDIIVGDFDSAKFPEIDTEIVAVPAEKDDTDTMLACNIAMNRGADNILILGGTGGRADHFLSNIFLLEVFKDKGVSTSLFDGENRITILKDESTVVKNTNGYFSLFALPDCILTLENCKYPLENYPLTRQNPSFAVSNEVVGDSALITVTGKAILCESKK